MREIIYQFITWVARVHDHILSINDSGGYYLDDKQLHFMVIGALGMALIFIIHPIFKWLVKNGHTMVVTWIYVFTVILVLTFAIEIGQWYSGTGQMDSEDIAYGISGFLVMFLIFAIVRGIFHGIKSMLKKESKDEEFRRSYHGY